VSIPRRLGRIARGFVSNLQEDDRFNEAIRSGRRSTESLKGALGDAWRGASDEWRTSEEQRKYDEAAREEDPNYGRREQESRDENREKNRGEARSSSRSSGWRSSAFTGIKYPPEVLSGYDRLGLVPGASLSEVDRKRRELIKKYHPDRFSDPDKRVRAERVSAEINAAHDKIERHLLKRK
jgi:DnaJ-domain-containing protein 1